MDAVLWVIAGAALGIMLSMLAIAGMVLWAARYWRG